jgi:hypothetical protein
MVVIIEPTLLAAVETEIETPSPSSQPRMYSASDIALRKSIQGDHRNFFSETISTEMKFESIDDAIFVIGHVLSASFPACVTTPASMDWSAL